MCTLLQNKAYCIPFHSLLFLSVLSFLFLFNYLLYFFLHFLFLPAVIGLFLCTDSLVFFPPFLAPSPPHFCTDLHPTPLSNPPSQGKAPGAAGSSQLEETIKEARKEEDFKRRTKLWLRQENKRRKKTKTI